MKEESITISETPTDGKNFPYGTPPVDYIPWLQQAPFYQIL